MLRILWCPWGRFSACRPDFYPARRRLKGGVPSSHTRRQRSRSSASKQQLQAELNLPPEDFLRGQAGHSDQGSQYSSHDWQAFLKAHNLVASMSRRGNCYDNAVAESFFQLLKRERIRRKIYLDREEARRDVFDYIEMFYNPKRRHGHANHVSPVEFENQYFNRLQSV